MARAGFRELVIGLAATGLLMGCVEGGGQTGATGAQVTAPGKKVGGARDVEAPEIYQTSDSALWDGRPSLGGIWVAAPDVDNPERVVIFNPASGKSITGALFKRERDNPGPRLQLSSDAAEALGILAGQPTEIRVTALRKEEVEAPAEAKAADPGAGGTEAAAIASAALDAVDSGPTDAAAATAAPAEATADGTAVAAVAAAGVAAAAPKKTWKERRAEAKAAREAKRRAAAEAKAAAAAAAAGTAAIDGEAPVASPDAAAAAVAPIESAPLDARSPEAAAANEPAPKRRVVGDAATPAATAPAAEAPAATGPARPIQVASFSKEDNANRAAEALAKIGVTATPQKSETGGKAVWGVVVMGDDAMLKKIRDAGFADAYYLK